MKTFMLQTINGEIKHDFVFHLDEAIRHQNWFYNEKVYDSFHANKPPLYDAIPVGSLEFVFMYLENNLGIKREDISPINVPEPLMENKFLKRKCRILKKEDIKFDNPYFVKSATTYKSYVGITDSNENLPDDYYFVSEALDIKSEWRSFVYHNKLVGLQNYGGDFTLFPDVSLINEMIKEYDDAPNAYTLDVGVNEKGTFIIEVHPFVSCGLYGFCDYRILPQMFIEGFQYFTK